MSTKTPITVAVEINASLQRCWQLWTTAGDIRQWDNPTDEWQNNRVEIDLKPGGSFLFRMEKKDGSEGFDHAGKYEEVEINERITYTGSDGRKSEIVFAPV